MCAKQPAVPFDWGAAGCVRWWGRTVRASGEAARNYFRKPRPINQAWAYKQYNEDVQQASGQHPGDANYGRHIKSASSLSELD
jgi:hypothetical protein